MLNVKREAYRAKQNLDHAAVTTRNVSTKFELLIHICQDEVF